MAEKNQPTRRQKPVSFRFQPDTKQLLEALSKALGLNHTDVMVLALRQLARRERIKPD